MSGLNPKFEKYASGFSGIYKNYFGKEPTMGELVFNGWLGIKDKKLKNFEKAGKEHARLLIGAAEDKELKESKING
jgi:hypothetical protein